MSTGTLQRASGTGPNLDTTLDRDITLNCSHASGVSTAENVWNSFMASLAFHAVLCRIFFKDQTESLTICLEVLEKEFQLA